MKGDQSFAGQFGLPQVSGRIKTARRCGPAPLVSAALPGTQPEQILEGARECLGEPAQVALVISSCSGLPDDLTLLGT